jgi:hypothetical protein
VSGEGRRPLGFAGAPFEARHRARLGPVVELGDLSAASVPAALLPRVRAEWQERARTEFRSIQIMTRFLSEVTGAGDPLDVYASVTELVEDEIRHAELCGAVCRRLSVVPLLPEPVLLPDPPEFLALPMPERALATAITMLGINETISTALITDLAERCDYQPIRRVLEATVADERTHGSFGWDYIQASLARFDGGSRESWRQLVAQTLRPFRARAVAPAAPAVDEQELVRFGVMSEGRQALLIERTVASVLHPRLSALGLL